MIANTPKWSCRANQVAAIVVAFGIPTVSRAADPCFPGLEVCRVETEVDSGVVTNDGSSLASIYSEVVTVEGATGMRLHFQIVELSGNFEAGDHSTVRMTSLQDGSQADFSAVTFRGSMNFSHWLNGDSVRLEIIAHPDTGSNQIQIDFAEATPPLDEAVEWLCYDRDLFRRGDVNDDGSVDLSDAIASLDRLFITCTRTACPDSFDVNDDGSLDISDPIALLGFLFLGAPMDILPFPDCGEDSTPDSFPACHYRGGCDEVDA